MAIKLIDRLYIPSTLSYANPNDPAWLKFFIDTIEVSTGRNKLERLYRDIRARDPRPEEAWSLILDGLEINRQYDSRRLAITQSRATVMPLYFHGQNSRLFQWASQVHVNLRLGLLLHEVRNKIERTLSISIGDPIHWEEMAPYTKRQELLNYLRLKTLEAGQP